MTISQLRNQINALKRKLAPILDAYRLKSAANHIVRRWSAAVEKKKPVPDPVDCVQIIAGAGFRPQAWNPLHAYIDQCQRYRSCPDAGEIINTLNPPRKLASLIAALPNPSPAS